MQARQYDVSLSLPPSTLPPLCHSATLPPCLRNDRKTLNEEMREEGTKETSENILDEITVRGFGFRVSGFGFRVSGLEEGTEEQDTR